MNFFKPVRLACLALGGFVALAPLSAYAVHYTIPAAELRLDRTDPGDMQLLDANGNVTVTVKLAVREDKKRHELFFHLIADARTDVRCFENGLLDPSFTHRVDAFWDKERCMQLAGREITQEQYDHLNDLASRVDAAGTAAERAAQAGMPWDPAQKDALEREAQEYLIGIVRDLLR